MAVPGTIRQTAVPLTATVVYDAEQFRDLLLGALNVAGAEVVAELSCAELNPQTIAGLNSRVLLVNLEASIAKRIELLSQIIDQFDGILVFNDADATASMLDVDRPRWIRHLASKISRQMDVLPPRPAQAMAPRLETEIQSKADFDIWFLVASIGGPEAMRLFLPELEQDLPVAFVLVQHIGPEFIDQMIRQLNELSPMPVVPATHGRRIEPGHIYVVPADKQTKISAQRSFQMSPLPTGSAYTPSIDQVLGDAVDRLGAGTNVIVFSGMANDGIAAATQLIDIKGEVWVQSPESCVVSSIVDGIVRYGGHGPVAEPAQLGQRLLATIKQSEQE